MRPEPIKPIGVAVQILIAVVFACSGVTIAAYVVRAGATVVAGWIW
jgi:hypothetical protein